MEFSRREGVEDLGGVVGRKNIDNTLYEMKKISKKTHQERR